MAGRKRRSGRPLTEALRSLKIEDGRLEIVNEKRGNGEGDYDEDGTLMSKRSDDADCVGGDENQMG
jgi:hypothetical protein